MNSNQQPQVNDHRQRVVTAPLDYVEHRAEEECMPDEYDNVVLGAESTVIHLTGEQL